MCFYFTTLVQTINTASVLLVCGYALRRGGVQERWVAALLLTDWLATPLLQARNPFQHTEFAIFLIDGLLMVVLAWISVFSSRFWPLWATAFQCLELLMHVAVLFDHRVSPRAYFVGMEISSYLILAALALGTWREAPKRAQANLSTDPA